MISFERFTFSLLDKEILSKINESWDFQSMGDSNKPHRLLLDRVSGDLDKPKSPSCHAPVYFAVGDKGQGGSIVAICEMVFSTFAGEVNTVKQMDTHLCPFLRDKVLLDEEKEAFDYAVNLYVASILHAIVLNETLHPQVLKLYARDRIQLEYFSRCAAAFSNKPEFSSLSVTIRGRWLEICGCLSEDAK